ncbi:MAG: efflux transporter outer membrane subunit [Thermoanaerobaculia bacterium]|nr:efflux transporter outer membrane subunit [Thermoanaerobaculia bacterium]
MPLREAEPFRGNGSAEVPDRWWHAFGDAALDREIDRALDANYTLLVAWERLREAEALARRTRADRRPDLDLSAGATSTDDSFAGEDGTDLDTGLRAGWEIDLWGRIDALAEADSLRAAASREDYRSATLALSAEVATIWYRLAEARLQQEVLDQQIATNETVLELQRVRFGAGLIRSADVLRQQALLEATRARRIDNRARITLLRHGLAVLQGRPPQEAPENTDALLAKPPPLPAAGLPAELVQRRPDVRAARLQVEAADREIAAALAARYPRLTLSGAVTTSDSGARNLFSDWITELAAGLVAPLIDGGERRADVERTRAVARGLLAEYADVVLISFREVEDALASESLQREKLANLDTQVDLARKTYEQLKVQYLNGVVDYLGVLDALTAEQDLVRERLSARLELLELHIALYRSLAGGFDTARETEEQEDREIEGARPGEKR